MKTHRTKTLILAAVAVAMLTACGSDAATQAADAPPAATSTPSAEPSAEPSPSSDPSAEPSPGSTGTPTAPPTGTSSPSPSAKPSSIPPASIPGFLAGTDMPKHPSSAWFAGKVTAGMPEFGPFCVEDALKTQKQLWHRQFGTEFDTNGSQVVVKTASVADAEAFMDVLAHGAALCAEDWLQGFPEGKSDSKDYGAPTANTRVYGVYTSVPESEDGAHLYGIGRDGVYVTVVAWSQMGNLSDAPVKAFEETLLTAVDKLA